jgi:signal transduction histidine kinase
MLDGVLELARGILKDLDLDETLERVLVAARELTGARYAAIGVLDRERTGLARFITSGLDQDEVDAIGPRPRGRGVLGALIDHPAPLRLDEVAAHPHSFGFPANHPMMRSFLGVPVLAGGEPYGNLYLTDKAGGARFSVEDERALTLLADFAGVAIDHARQYAGSETERRALSRTVAALDASVQIALALGGQSDVGKVLGLVAERGRALVGARALAIEVLDGDELVVAAASGDVPGELVGLRVPVADTVAETALRRLATQRLEDPENAERFQAHGLGRLGFAARAGLAVPLVFRGAPYGVLIAAADGVGEDDVRLMESFAASAATAVATAQSAATEQRRMRIAATEAERARWARELHDETLQSLAALRLGLAAARRAAGSGSAEALDALLAEALGQLDGEIATLRGLITELRPAALDELGLAAAIGALAERSAVSGLSVDLDVAVDEAVVSDPDRQIAIYRIVQEALSNARKHGGARRAVATVAVAGGRVEVSVRDDGSGFDPARATDGFGVLGMHERAELLGGTVVVTSSPGAGTTVAATIPLAEPPLGRRLA